MSITELPHRTAVQAEIEHFVNGDDKSHPKFASVADLKPLLYSRYVCGKGGRCWMSSTQKRDTAGDRGHT